MAYSKEWHESVTRKGTSTHEGVHFAQDWFASDEELFQEVPLANIRGIAERMGEDLKLSEMSQNQLAFLCGLLRQEKPAKVVEVGISAGATTAVIVNCLNDLEMDPKKICLYSIDINTQYYQNPEYESGFIARKYDQGSHIHHEYMLGNVCAVFLDEICADGEGIDFLILDTSHSLPGEILDFLVCLPYLNPGAIVVLHDVTLCLWNWNNPSFRDCFATGILFSAVQGEKFYTTALEGKDSLSYIAAFRVNTETKRQIRNVFFALTPSWHYFPCEKEEIESYRKVIEQAYDSSLVELFDRIVELQKKMWMEKIPQQLGCSSEILLKRWSECDHVYLYGTKELGYLCYYWARLHGLKLDGLIVSDGRPISELTRAKFDVPVYHLSQVPAPSEICGVILAMNKDNCKIVYKNLLGTPMRILNDTVVF